MYVHKNTNLLLLLLVSIHCCLSGKQPKTKTTYTQREMVSKGFWRVVSQIHVSTAWTLKQEKTKQHKIQLMMGEKIPLLLNEQVNGWNPGRRKYCLFFPQISLSTTLASRYYSVTQHNSRWWLPNCALLFGRPNNWEQTHCERKTETRDRAVFPALCVCHGSPNTSPITLN